MQKSRCQVFLVHRPQVLPLTVERAITDLTHVTICLMAYLTPLSGAAVPVCLLLRTRQDFPV